MIRETFREFEQSALAAMEDGVDIFVTLRWKPEPQRWIQLTRLKFNAHYPYTTHPDEKLRAAHVTPPKDCRLSEWEANRFATWEHGHAQEPEVLADFAEAYAEKILNISTDTDAYEVEYDQ